MKVVEYGRGEAPRETAQPAQGTATSELPARYQPSRQPRWIALGLIFALHAAVLVALQYMGLGTVRHSPAPPLVMDLLPLEPPRPPEPAVLPTQKEVESTPKRQRVIAPAPIVVIPAAPAAVQMTTEPELTPPAPVKAEEQRPAPHREAEAPLDLNTRLLSADPPAYPAESRRRRESGTVILMVVVDDEGRVSAISVAESSGVDRLDKAALRAVQRWRWSPAIVDGRPSQVRGLVRIPFELKEAH